MAVFCARVRRRLGIINAIAVRFDVLVDPELFNALMELSRDPVAAVGEAVVNMRKDEIVLTIDHFEVGP